MATDIRFGIIGLGLMGREFASAAARWIHLSSLDVRPVLVAACDTNEKAFDWFKANVPTIRFTTRDYHELLHRNDIDAIYCAVPHHLHGQFYCDIINAGKHLLGEKPFGIDLPANRKITETIERNPKVFVRCSSELPFFPGYRDYPGAAERRFRRDRRSGKWSTPFFGPEPAKADQLEADDRV